MGDLKTFYDNAIYPNTSDLSGEVATERGSDPNAEQLAGPAAIIDFWEKRPYPWPPDSPGQVLPEDPNPSIEESRNSVSGLPPLPNRFAPTEAPPEIPTLQDRNPGTIDKR